MPHCCTALQRDEDDVAIYEKEKRTRKLQPNNNNNETEIKLTARLLKQDQKQPED